MLIQIVVAALLASVFSFSAFAEDKVMKPTTINPAVSLNEFATAKPPWPMLVLATKLASLPASKVKLQDVCKKSPAVGGFETVFEIGDMHYTCWLYRDADTQENMFRVYYHKIGESNRVSMIIDNNVDGHFNNTMPPDDKTSYYLQSYADHKENTHPTWKHVVVQGAVDTPEERKKAYDFWTDEYRKVISDIRAFVYTTAYTKLKEGQMITNIYDPLNRLIAQVATNRTGCYLEEWSFNPLGQLVHHRTRILVKEK